MKWLVNAQLPPSLCIWLQRRQQQSIHVFELEGGLAYPDEKIWHIAQSKGYTIITKDRDFYERVVVLGSPPQVLYVDVGNCSNKDLFLLMNKYWSYILKAVQASTALIILSQSSMYVYEK